MNASNFKTVMGMFTGTFMGVLTRESLGRGTHSHPVFIRGVSVSQSGRVTLTHEHDHNETGTGRLFAVAGLSERHVGDSAQGTSTNAGSLVRSKVIQRVSQLAIERADAGEVQRFGARH